MKKLNINIYEVVELPIGDMELHELAHEHPKMTDSEFERLKVSINEIGQQEEILVYRNKIVDGRHRWWAIEALNLPTIRTKIIPHNTPLETVREMVFGSEIRRHQTATQKAIKGWRATKEYGLTYREAEAKYMTSRTMIAACNYIAEHRGEKALNALYAQEPVYVGDRHVTTLNSLKKLIEKEEEAAMHARLKEENQSPHHVAEYCKQYLGPLRQESTEVVEYIAKGAYSILKRRE